MPLRILLADDHIVVRQGLKALLEREGLEVIGEASDGREAVQLAKTLSPDVAVLDLAMPLLNGLDAAQGIHHSTPRTRTILLTMHTEDHQVVKALQVGVRGYVVKTQAGEDLVQAINEVSQGRIYLSPGISEVVVEGYLAKTGVPPEPLTPRQREVMQLVAEGKTTKEIASLLGLKVKTVESYRGRIMERLNIHETAGLVRYAIRRGLIQP
ncbi:MAG TPA: response regulator transcription factor [Candidatus Methylomirabilis sp.]|nr:response regulator transcription factor [Candidatus Methylomirabilis sp.]